MKDKKPGKIAKIILDVLMYVFLGLCIVTVVITVTSKRSPDGASRIFGYEMRLVLSDSMDKSEYTDVSKYEIGSIPKDAMIFIETVPDDDEEATAWYRSLKEGDVLTFRYVYATQKTITHRITSIKENASGGFTIKLTGDNKNSEDGRLEQEIDTSIPNSTNYVIGKVIGKSYPVGLVMTLLKTKVGIICAVILPCAIIIAIEVAKIIKALGADKKEKYQLEKEQKEQELEELKRRLAELEALKNSIAEKSDDEEKKE